MDKPSFKIEVSTGDACFGDDPEHELGIILRKLAFKLENGSLWIGVDYPIISTDGNKVGFVRFNKTKEKGKDNE